MLTISSYFSLNISLFCPGIGFPELIIGRDLSTSLGHRIGCSDPTYHLPFVRILAGATEHVHSDDILLHGRRYERLWMCSDDKLLTF